MNASQSRWYILRSKPCQEFRAFEELQKQNYEVFLPTIRTEKTLNGLRTEKSEVLFPRYMFIYLDSITSMWSPIGSIKGVSNLVKFGLQTPSLSREHFSCFRQWFQLVPRNDDDSPDEVLQIASDPFSGMQTLFEKLVEIKNGEERAIVLFEILGKTQRISVPLTDLH